MDILRDNEYEEEIDLKQLLIYVLRKWRIMLAAAVFFGLLLGGMKVAKGFLDLQDPEKVEESIKEAELARENYDTAKTQLTNQIAEYNHQLEDYQRYAENSLYMKIDPYAVCKERVTYVVTTDYQILPNMTYQTLNWMGPVLSAYASIASSVTLNELPAEGRNGLSDEWDADSLDKLIRVETNVDEGKLTITTSAESTTRAKAILQTIKEKIKENQENVARVAGEHKLSVISEKSTITVDQSMINDRETRLKNIAALRDAADKAIEKYKKLSEPASTELSLSSVMKKGIKFGVLGALAGVLWVCCCYGTRYLFDGLLHDPESLKKQFRTKILAVLTEKENKNRIDRMLDSLSGIPNTKDSGTLAICTTAASLDATGGKKILVAGTVSETDSKNYFDDLSSKVSVSDIKYGGNILQSIDALEKLKSVDSVVLVEKKDVSKMMEIQRELEIIHYLGKTVEGFLLIG